MPNELRFELSKSWRLWCIAIFIAALAAASVAAFLYSLNLTYLPAIAALLVLLMSLRRLDPSDVTLVCQTPEHLRAQWYAPRWQLRSAGSSHSTAQVAGVLVSRCGAAAWVPCELRCLRRFNGVLHLEVAFPGPPSNCRQLLVFADSLPAGEWRWLRCMLRLQNAE